MNEARPDNDLNPTQIKVKNLAPSEIYFDKLNTNGILGEKVRVRLEDSLLDKVLSEFRSQGKINDIEVDFDKANFFHIKNAVPESFQRLGFATKIYLRFIDQFGYMTTLKGFRTPDSEKLWSNIISDPSRINADIIQYGEDDPSVEEPFTIAIKKGYSKNYLRNIAKDIAMYYKGMGMSFEPIQFSDDKLSKAFVDLLRKYYSDTIIGEMRGVKKVGDAGY